MSTSVTTLHRAPFSAWLNHYIAIHGDLAAAALRLGMDASGLNRHVRGQAAGRLTPRMHLGVADHVFTAADEPHQLALLYPLDEPAHDRWCQTCDETVTTNQDLRCPWCEQETTP